MTRLSRALVPRERLPRPALGGIGGRGGLDINDLLRVFIEIIDNILIPLIRFFVGLGGAR